ncbi:MAG TPA: N-acetylmuramoyl-L-alanine amidase-like domain-containing protein [Blastocatellia bacterium]|nr:N-acetylmuramoyl-L-alanine amidase-like domain-containing protein [Blastocatellia bacterium]
MRNRDAISTEDRERISRLLKAIRHERALEKRIEYISAQFLGLPYVVNPLGGGPDEPEIFTVSLSGFDCVTYIETALALALARDWKDFPGLLRSIRYENGQVDWSCRNHYMVDWAENNQAAGFIVNVTEGEETVIRTRTLGLVSGLPQKTVTIRCFPKRKLARIANRIETGDLILFVSTRRKLDVFHTGLLVRDDDRILLRHATRKIGAVVEQELSDFLGSDRMSGFILLRPQRHTD